MQLRTIQQYGDAKNFHELLVTVEGEVVSISGSFTSSGVAYPISPTNYTVHSESEDMYVGLYIVKDKQAGTVHVFVDEVLPPNDPYTFENDPDHELLWNIAILKVPAGATAFDDVVVKTFAFAKARPEKAKPTPVENPPTPAPHIPRPSRER